MRYILMTKKPVLAVITLLSAAGLMAFGCDDAKKAKDNFDSRITCEKYCNKKFDCADQDASGDESDTCVSACRNSIEDKCGNNHQAAANAKIETCVDKGCAEFTVCMVFEAAPECFGFTTF